eukprot:gene24062-32477_t
MEEPSKKRAREESSEWIEGFSSKYKRKYWFNNITGKSVWEDPQPSQNYEEVSTGLSLTGGNSSSSISSQHLKLMEFLQTEHQEAEKEVPDHNNSTPRCPRLIDSVNLPSLLAALRKETAGVVTVEESHTPNERPLPPFKIVFSLANDNTAMITRAIQEDEILKTRLLVYSGTEKDGSPRAQVLPSFWEVWSRSDILVSQILSAADPHEMKWQMQREEVLTPTPIPGKGKGGPKGKFQYKLATTFMPAYAKQIYSYFQAKHVLDPCAGWGDRLLGLLELNDMHLESCDSDTLTCREGFQVNSLPFEVGARKLEENSFDLVFTSPPFFDYEMYRMLVDASFREDSGRPLKETEAAAAEYANEDPLTRFTIPTSRLPPYASVPWYDAKLWQFVQVEPRPPRRCNLERRRSGGKYQRCSYGG